MGRLKKRVQRRLKKQVKQSIKKPKTLTKTPEQQAKENEMIKVMLSRQPQIIAGQAQKNDKLQEQLDLQKNVMIAKQKEFQNQQDLLKQYKAEMDKMKSEINQAKAKRVNEEKINKEKEKGNREKEKEVRQLEKEEKRGQQLDDKNEELEERRREFNEKTKEGEHRKRMTEMEGEERELRRKIAENEKQIREDTLYSEYKTKRDELEILNAQVASQEQILNSPEYKNRKDELIKTNKELFEAREKKRFNDLLRERQQEKEILEAESEGQKQYLDELKKTVPQKDSIFYETATEQNQKQLAKEVVALQQARAKNDKYKEEIRMREDLNKQVRNQKWDNDILEKENDALNEYVNSKSYISQVELIETQKAQEEQRKEQLDFQRQTIATKQRLQRLDAQQRIREQFDPSNTDLAGVQTQIQELTKQANDTYEKNDKVIQDNIKLNKQQQAFYTARDNLLNRYENDKQRDIAKDNYFKLIEHKIGGKLPEYIDDWDINNLERTTAFTEMLGKLTPELLTSPDLLNKFVQGEEFNNFEWKVV